MLKRIIKKSFEISFLLTRPMTMGVRVILLDETGSKVLLVNHTYVEGWHLPGGGIDPGETAEMAALRELQEECAIQPNDRLSFQSLHFNKAVNNRDHVALYIGYAAVDNLGFMPSREIKAAQFFPLNALPEGITEPTRNRLLEYAGEQEIDSFW